MQYPVDQNLACSDHWDQNMVCSENTMLRPCGLSESAFRPCGQKEFSARPCGPTKSGFRPCGTKESGFRLCRPKESGFRPCGPTEHPGLTSIQKKAYHKVSYKKKWLSYSFMHGFYRKMVMIGCPFIKMYDKIFFIEFFFRKNFKKSFFW